MAITSEAYAGQSPGYGSGLLINKEDGLFRYTMPAALLFVSIATLQVCCM